MASSFKLATSSLNWGQVIQMPRRLMINVTSGRPMWARHPKVEKLTNATYDGPMEARHLQVENY